MTGYLFYPPADAAQDRIWRDTMESWSEMQAETYIVGLHGHLLKLSRTRALWRPLPQRLVVTDLGAMTWFSRCERHHIFFRELSGGRIGIIGILHERMDLPVRLAEDLLHIAQRDTDES
jgi:plasmid stabilization system protein ParE